MYRASPDFKHGNTSDVSLEASEIKSSGETCCGESKQNAQNYCDFPTTNWLL